MKRNAVDRVVEYFRPAKAVARYRARHLAEQYAKGGYDAAGRGRRQLHRGSDSSANVENRHVLSLLRANNRELVRNNAYAAIAVNRIPVLSVGTGILPKARGGSARKRKLADKLMREWMRSTGCDFDGRNNLFGLQHLVARTEAESGEALAQRKIVNDPSLAIPLKIMVLEGDLIDHAKDTVGGFSDSTERSVQGVQFDQSGQRSGYWMFDEHPGERGFHVIKSGLVPASQIGHVYQVLRPGQVRGVPRAVSSHQHARGLYDFRDARIEQQKQAANFVGTVSSALDAESVVDGEPLPETLEPGFWGRLHPGDEVHFNQPPTVSGQDAFTMSEERIIASVWGITYEELTGDYSKVNFASGKLARLAMYQNIRNWQDNMLIPHFCKTVERWFLEAAFFRGIDLSGISFDWRPPRKEILDLKNELPAIIKEIRAGLNSWQNALRERGIDPLELAEDYKEDNELWDRLGLTLDVDGRNVTINGQLQSTGGANADSESAGSDDNDSE